MLLAKLAALIFLVSAGSVNGQRGEYVSHSCCNHWSNFISTFKSSLLMFAAFLGIRNAPGLRSLQNGIANAMPDGPIVMTNVTMPDELKKLAAMEGYDVSLLVPKGVDSPTRRAQTITTWYCRTKDTKQDVGVARIDWGHTKADAEWACNACVGTQVPSKWRLRSVSGNEIHVELLQSQWPQVHQQCPDWLGPQCWDGIWACNNWVSECGNSNGGCIVTGGIVWSDGSSSCNTKTTSGGCSGGFDWERRALKKSCDQHDYC